MRILVGGSVVRFPVAGLAWHYFQYVRGLADSGHDVWFVEDSGDDLDCCYNPATHTIGPDPAYGLEFAQTTLTRLDLADRWAYYDARRRKWDGPAAGRILDVVESADVFLNVSGAVSMRPWFAEVPVRVLVDTDPAFQQVRHLTDPNRAKLAAAHTAFFTYGENVGLEGCSIPDDGFGWQPTRQPVTLDLWPVTPPPAGARLTTVMQWDSYRALEWAGVHYGMKSDSFIPYIDFPRRTAATLELAISSSRTHRDLLAENGWHLRDPLEVASDSWAYQRYLQGSLAEFTLAKHGYVMTASGWFSERSAAYLASGRPVVTQDTGFTRWLSADLGVLPFNTPEEAVAAIEDLRAIYPRHQHAARAIAHEYFEAGAVLGDLLGRSGGARNS